MIGLALTLDLFGAPPLLGELELGRAPSLWAVLALGYLGTGAALAWHLGRRGHGLGVTTSALACWPLLLGLIGRPPADPNLRFEAGAGAGAGPNAARIDGCLRALGQSLAETLEAGAGPGSTPLIDAATLAKLGDALHRADARIARVDRLLRETEAARALVDDPALEAALTSLRRARAHASAELEAVLAGLVQLRVQLGLVSLAGETEPVRERLAELEDRLAALAQLASIDLDQVGS